MRKLFFVCFALFSLASLAQTHTFDTVAFVQGGQMHKAPQDNILQWSDTKYQPFAAKKTTDPGIAYFYTQYTPSTFVNNTLHLDGTLYAGGLSSTTNTNQSCYMWPYYFALSYIHSGFTHSYWMKYDLSSDVFWINCYGVGESTAKSDPVYIGDNSVASGRVNEQIIVDPANHRFDINMGKTRLYQGTAGKWLYLDANKEISYADLTAASVGLGNVTNNAQVTAVTAAEPVSSTGGLTPVISMSKSDYATNGYLSKEDFNLFTAKVSAVSAVSPLQSTGGYTPELHILRSTDIESGYLHKDDYARFNSIVSSQWEANSAGIGYNSGFVGIGTKIPAYACDVAGTFNAYDYKSTGSYVTLSRAYAGVGMLSGIWQDAIATTPNGSHLINHSVTVAPDQGSFFSCYDATNLYNYKVGIFDGQGGIPKTFAGIVGGTGGTVNLGSTIYPWGKGFFSDQLATQKISATDVSVSTLVSTGNVGIGTTSPSSLFSITTNVSTPINVYQYGAAGVATPMLCFSARGTNTSPLPLQITDVLIGMNGRGYGSSGYSVGGRLQFVGAAAETWTDAAQGTYFRLNTTQIGTILTTEKIRVTDIGNVGVGTSAPTALLDVNSDVMRLRTSKTPATSSAGGNEGDMCADANYIYFYKSGSWRRATLATW